MWGCVYWMGWLGYTVVCVCVYVYLCVLEHFCVHMCSVCVCVSAGECGGVTVAVRMSVCREV